MILNKLRKTIKNFDLLHPKDVLIIGVSGGSDSVGLLYLLDELIEFDLRIIVAHVNHGLRGKDSDDDQKYVGKIAERLGFEFETTKVDTISHKNKFKLSLEDAARELRYKFFNHLCKKYSGNKIVTAHTLNDQAETVLMRLIRGSATLGLSAISPSDGKLIRPLINITKNEVVEYLRSKKVKWREDVTNISSDFLRNRIRNELIPILENYNPSIQETLSRSAIISGIEYEYLNNQVNSKFEDLISKVSLGFIGTTDKLMNEPLAIRFGIIRACISKIKGDLKKLSAKHLFLIDEVLNSPESSGEVDLPEKIVFCKGHGFFYIGKREKIDKEYHFKISEMGSFRYSDDLEIEIDITNELENFGDKNIAYFSVDKIGFPIEICSYQEGDKFVPLGMKGYKKLKDFYIDEKIPRFLRKKIPVFKTGHKVFWLGGMRVDDRFKTDVASKNYLKIKISGFIDEFESLISKQRNLIH
ncbi:MAG: tRNA lysidine(34) synthetase TilS [Candidatus Dadabacteria bacterium]|nr:tRNA lysidine(34) synthetase TilS [Candidatus Dadabacteria bacterium]NIQ16609.1 tRNA lysidine(34) synthetase TilS [Candidatus Dadabacteria bacterium]